MRLHDQSLLRQSNLGQALSRQASANHSRLRPTLIGHNYKEFNNKEFRRQVTAAVAQHRNTDSDDALPLTSGLDLKAQLMPLDEQGRTGRSCQIEVKDFDERGITFQHPQPLHGRRALVVLEGLNLGRITAEVDLSWCRFSRRGHYTSGGRFVVTTGKTA